MGVSPILGFLLAGVLMRELNLLADPSELTELAELGVLFLLFEMGLELTSARLRALRVYAFGLGTAQVFFTVAAFVAFAYPFGNSIGTILLEVLANAQAGIASIRTWDEAIVIAVALSLSSSAFVLQLLGDQGQLATRSGSAMLGILLLQDLVTVPFLVLLPILENTRHGDAAAGEDLTTLAAQLLPAAAKSLGILGGIAVLGRVGLRRVFAAVASSSSNDAFVAACLLTVCGTASATQAAGFGQTFGAFLAGVILAESSFRPQVEAELKPFKGVLLGLFFLCTGASVDVNTLFSEFPIIALLTIGLISVKFAITSLSARAFGLSQAESAKVGMTLSQGGEFAFVLLALAQEERILPDELNKILICVVVLSMALTPFLADLGDKFEADELKAEQKKMGESLKWELMRDDNEDGVSQDVRQALEYTDPRPVVILGFNDASQVVANMLSSPLAKHPWVGFSFNPDTVRLANAAGLPVFFGDGSCKDVLHAAGADKPRAFILTLRSHPMLMSALKNIKSTFPEAPVYALARDMRRAVEVKAMGAKVIAGAGSAGLALGDVVLRGLLDTSAIDMVFLEQEMALAMQRKVVEKATKEKAGPLDMTPRGAFDDDDDLKLFVLDRAQLHRQIQTEFKQDKKHQDKAIAKLRLSEANGDGDALTQEIEAGANGSRRRKQKVLDAFAVSGSGDWEDTASDTGSDTEDDSSSTMMVAESVSSVDWPTEKQSEKKKQQAPKKA